MLESIEMINFQSHRHTKLMFSPNVNVILGETDSGKSSIIRAIDWVVNNYPSGDSICSDWGGDTSVKIVTDDKHIIEKKRTSKGISYSLDGMEFKAVGKGNVPEEISSVFRISDINLQKQFKAAFLLDLSSGNVAKELNKCANLDTIDAALQNINKQAQQEKATLKNMEIAFEGLEKQNEDFKWVDDAEEKIVFLETIDSEISLSKEKVRFLEETVDKIVKINSKKKELENILAFDDKVNLLLSISDDINIMQKSINQKVSYIAEHEDIRQMISHEEGIVKHEDEIKKLLNISEDLEKEHIKINSLGGHCTKIVKLNKKIDNTGESIKLETKKFKELMGDICILCERPL